MQNVRIAVVVVSIVFACAAPWCAAAAGPRQGEERHLKGHADAVLAAAFSPDGTRVVSGSADQTAIIWDVARGTAVHKLSGHEWAVVAVAFSADGRRVVTASLDRTARVWDARTGELVSILRGGHTDRILSAAISPGGDRVLTGSSDHTVVLWDVAAKQAMESYAFAGEPLAVGFSPDGKTFFSGHADRGPNAAAALEEIGPNLRVYDAATTRLLGEVELPAVDEAGYVEGGKRLVARCGAAAWTVDVQSRSARPLRDPKYRFAVDRLAASSDGKAMLVARSTGIEYADVAGGAVSLHFPSPAETVRVVAMSADGAWGLFAGGGMTDRPWADDWDRASETRVTLVSLVTDPAAPRFAIPDAAGGTRVEWAAASADARRVLAVTYERRATLWDAASGKVAAQFPLADAVTGDVALTATGGLFATPSGDHVVVYDAATGKPAGGADAFASPVSDIAFAPALTGAKLIAVASGPNALDPSDKSPNELAVVDYATRRRVRDFAGVSQGVRYVAYSPDGATLLTSSSARGRATAQAWDARTGAALWTFDSPRSDESVPVSRPVVSPDGRWVALGANRATFVLDARTGKLAHALEGHAGRCSKVAFDPDGKRLWTIAVDDAVRSWDVASGKRLSETTIVLRRSDPVATLFRGGQRTLLDVGGEIPRAIELDR